MNDPVYSDLSAVLGALFTEATEAPKGPGFADLTLAGMLNMMAALPKPRPMTIVVTRWVFGAYTVSGEGDELYILTDAQALDQIVRQFPAVPVGAGFVPNTLTGIPVVYDDDLAVRLILGTLRKAAS